MTSATGRRIDRRTFLVDLGRGTCALVVFGVAAACSPAASSSPSARPSVAASPSPEPTAPSPSPKPSGPPPAATWERVNLGFVSAYVLARGGEAAIVDTGVAGSADAIESALEKVRLDWSDVGHVILTHLHPDHVGGLPEVMTRAASAKGYAAAPDNTAINSPRALTEVKDGDTVFDLKIVATPGHTKGSISVLDPSGKGTFVAGDALTTTKTGVSGPDPQFTLDMKTAEASVKTIAGLTFETLFVGHGEPIAKGASAAVAKFAKTL